MKSFRSTRFGDLTFAEPSVITLVDGLVGLPRLRRWIMLDMDRGLPLKWLQSLDDAGFSVPVLTPDLFGAEDLAAAVGDLAGALGGEPGEPVAVLVITTVHAGGTRLTGNLAAPLVIHIGTRRGMQLVMDDRRWPMRQEIDYVRFGLAAQAAGGAAPAAAAPELSNVERQEITL
jgi:flagellar assembly factor FliW